MLGPELDEIKKSYKPKEMTKKLSGEEIGKAAVSMKNGKS